MGVRLYMCRAQPGLQVTVWEGPFPVSVSKTFPRKLRPEVYSEILLAVFDYMKEVASKCCVDALIKWQEDTQRRKTPFESVKYCFLQPCTQLTVLLYRCMWSITVRICAYCLVCEQTHAISEFL